MIHDDQELHAAQERVAYFERLMMQLRVTATPLEFPSLMSGYHSELRRLQHDILDYLSRHASIPARTSEPASYTTLSAEEIRALPLQEKVRLACEATIDEVIERHGRAGLPIAILRDGKVVEVTPEELKALRAAKHHAQNGTPHGQ